MLESKAKIKTKNFLRYIELLGQTRPDRMVEGFQGTEKELIRQFTTDTLDLIEHGEWRVGLENLLTNIYEIEFTVDKIAIELAKDAIKECGMDLGNWTCKLP
jgi:hypothetical protein